MKKFISAVFMALLIVTLTFPAFAAEPLGGKYNSVPIHTDYVNIRLLQTGLTIDSSGMARCTGRVTLYSSSNTAKLTLVLQKYTGSGVYNKNMDSICPWDHTHQRCEIFPCCPGSISREYYG